MTVENLKRRIGSVSRGEDGGPRPLVLGGGHVGHLVAGALAPDQSVTIVDESENVCRRAANDVDETVCGNPATAEVLERADAHAADAAIVATRPDTKTFLATQLLRTRFDVDTVVAMVDDPECTDAIGDRADAVVTAPPMLADELTTTFERVSSSTVRW